jgi:hypothetical protein
MHIRNTTALAGALLSFALLNGGAQAQTIQFTVRDIALKNGESTEFGDVFYIASTCKSILKATPAVEILDGPPGVTAVINPAKVVPHGYGCAKPVDGGKLVIAANDVADYSYTRMVLRINYQTLDGPRQRTQLINITLVPSD